MEENKPKILIINWEGPHIRLRELMEAAFNTAEVIECKSKEDFPVGLFPPNNLSGAICESLKTYHDQRLREIEMFDSTLIVAPSRKTKGKHLYPFYHTGKY